MRHQALFAAGFLSIFVVPALLLLGMSFDAPSLAFGIVIFVFPFARRFFGKLDADEPTLWREGLATALDWLPIVYAIALLVTFAMVLVHLRQPGPVAASHAVGLGLSLWMTMLFATCVAHDLVHRRDWRMALTGGFVAGLAGYPVLAHEHMRHHARAGSSTLAEWPRFDETVWQFAWRRAASVVTGVYGLQSAIWRLQAHGGQVFETRVATLTSLATCGLFVWAGGWTGAAVYLGAAFGVIFGMQLFTYIQHWGLGEDRLGARALQGFGWEDDCRMQAWMTLGISLHHAHHQQGNWPYYRTALGGHSPRLPAGYVVLMFVCLVPQLWRRVMVPALMHWEQHPDDPRSPGRDLTCFHLYGDAGQAGMAR